jgi:hypothetical protein
VDLLGDMDYGKRVTRIEVDARMDLPEWIVALGLRHKLFREGTLVLPEGAHAFWDDLERGRVTKPTEDRYDH